MPRPSRAYGRPGTSVIPKDWSPSHGRVIAKTWTATCKIYGPRAAGPLTVNADLSVTPGDAPTPLYEGPCRIQQLNAQESSTIVGDQEQTTVAYLVVIDRDAVIPHKSLVLITDVDDPALTARRLVTRRTVKGSQVWERDLYAVEDQTAPDPT